MEVIPSVNVADFEQARRTLGCISTFLPENGWVHVDVGDGIFTPNVTWGNPAEFLRFMIHDSRFKNLNTEVHLMVEGPDALILPWLEAGAKRILVHTESLEDFEYAQEICRDHGAELGLVLAPETSVEEVSVYFHKVHFFQVLAVDPGHAGQTFQEMALEKIRQLRQAAPDAILEVDGGITPEVARWAKEAGAGIVVSASYIFKSSDPGKAYEELKNI